MQQMAINQANMKNTFTNFNNLNLVTNFEFYNDH